MPQARVRVREGDDDGAALDGRARRDTAPELLAPRDLTGVGVDGEEAAFQVPDEDQAVADRRRELHEPASLDRPDTSERRPVVKVGRDVSAGFVVAVLWPGRLQ